MLPFNVAQGQGLDRMWIVLKEWGQKNNTRAAMFGEGQWRPATSELAVGTESVACWVEWSAQGLFFSS